MKKLIFLVTIVFTFTTQNCFAARSWSMLAQKSKLEFEGKYQGEGFVGKFNRFQPSVVFDPNDLAHSKLDVSIDMTSADSADPDRDSTLKESDFFSIAKFPKARFVTQSIQQTAPGQYKAKATLTIRNKTQAIEFPFRFTAVGDGARLQAEVILNRTKFDVGLGDWTDASIIAHEVKVRVDLQLKPAPASTPPPSKKK